MLYPYNSLLVATSQNTISLDANVQAAVNAINSNLVIPYGDYGGPTVYYFQTQSSLGNLLYTMFDKTTNLGLASFSVRYGAATTIRQAILMPFPRSQIELQFLILPYIPASSPANGSVTPS